MKRFWMVLGIAALVALVGAAALGAVVFAQDDEDGTGWPYDIRERMKEAVAKALGIEVQEYEDALETAREQVLEEAVTEGHLTQEQADRMRERGAEAFGPHAREGYEHRMPGMAPYHGGQSSAAALADLLGLTPEELLAELKDGKTLADVAKAQEVKVEAVVEALMAPKAERLAQAVEAGRLTQEKADEMLGQMEAGILKAVEEGIPAWGPGPGRFPKDGSRMKPYRFGDIPGQGES